MKYSCQICKILAGILFDKISLESTQAYRYNYQVEKQVNSTKTQKPNPECGESYKMTNQFLQKINGLKGGGGKELLQTRKKDLRKNVRK